MKNKEKLKIWKKVNKCKTLKSLSKVILSLADDDGMIQGRIRKFNAKRMSEGCIAIGVINPNVLTREFGIRQQAMYINYYE